MSERGTRIGNVLIPAVLLHEFREESVDVILRFGGKQLTFQEELLPIRDRIVEALKNLGHVVHNGPTFCYADVDVTEDAGQLRVEVELGKSEYFNNLFHLGLDEPLRSQDPQILESLTKLVEIDRILDPTLIGGYPLSSGVGVTTVARLVHGTTLLTRRSKSVAVQPGRIHVAAAEALSMRDLEEHKTVDLKGAILRSLYEEILREGTQLNADDIGVHVFGLSVDLRLMWPGFLAEISLPFTWEQIEAGQGFAPDKWERDKIWPVKLDPESCAKELRNISEWTGFGSLALVLSLIREYGEERVNQAFR